MLPREHRLHRPADFTEVVRRGRRVSRPLLSVHALLAGPPVPGASGRDASVSDPSVSDPSVSGPPAPPGPPRAGLVVSKAVGGSVVRSTVSRRLRHLLVARLSLLPAGARVVVRAAPAAGTASSAALGRDLDAALPSALRPGSPRHPAGGAGPRR